MTVSLAAAATVAVDVADDEFGAPGAAGGGGAGARDDVPPFTVGVEAFLPTLAALRTGGGGGVLRASKDAVHVFLNARPVELRAITRAVTLAARDAAGGCGGDRFPLAVVLLTVPSELVDPNIDVEKRRPAVVGEAALGRALRAALTEDFDRQLAITLAPPGAADGVGATAAAAGGGGGAAGGASGAGASTGGGVSVSRAGGGGEGLPDGRRTDAAPLHPPSPKRAAVPWSMSVPLRRCRASGGGAATGGVEACGAGIDVLGFLRGRERAHNWLCALVVRDWAEGAASGGAMSMARSAAAGAARGAVLLVADIAGVAWLVRYCDAVLAGGAGGRGVRARRGVLAGGGG